MQRLLVVFGLALTITLQAGTARADMHNMKAKWHAFWDRVHVDWHRNNAWPEPFNHIDERATRTPLAIMADNGWKLQNTISHQLFDPESQELTRAGELKVRWILTQMPMHRRSVFVLRGESPEVTETRVNSVEKLAESLLGEPGLAMISVTDIVPRGGSGDYFERVNRGYENSVPAPRLPDMGGGDN
jgi:hypothetical protein